jgi:hypothetical protein
MTGNHVCVGRSGRNNANQDAGEMGEVRIMLRVRDKK